MHTSSPLLSMSLKSLFTEIFCPSPEVWGVLSDDELNAIKLRCDTHWVQSKWLHSPKAGILLSFVLAVAAIGATFAGATVKDTITLTVVSSLALATVVATVITWGGLALAFGAFISPAL